MDVREPRRVGQFGLRQRKAVLGLQAEADGVQAREELADDVGDLAVVGVLLAKGEEVRLNEDAGYLVRTKGELVDEGGVSAGYACLNSLLREW